MNKSSSGDSTNRKPRAQNYRECLQKYSESGSIKTTLFTGYAAAAWPNTPQLCNSGCAQSPARWLDVHVEERAADTLPHHASQRCPLPREARKDEATRSCPRVPPGAQHGQFTNSCDTPAWVQTPAFAGPAMQTHQ